MTSRYVRQMKFLLLVVVVLALAMLASSQMARRRDRNKTPHASAERDLAEVEAAISAGEKIRAIKIYREVTNADLLTAKTAVDRIERGEDPAVAPQASAQSLAAVRAALASGESIRAVKIYREATGTDLLTAKNAVDLIARGENPQPLDR